MSDIKVPFKYDSAGRRPSKSLFEDGTYNIEEFHDVFLELEDPTEYKPALQLCGSWREWNRLKRDWPQFNAYIEEWKAELDVKLQSRAVDKVKTLMDSDNYQAAKFISEGGWNKRAGAGRPSKAERSRAAKEIASQAAETKAEEDRILKLINGGGNK